MPVAWDEFVPVQDTPKDKSFDWSEFSPIESAAPVPGVPSPAEQEQIRRLPRPEELATYGGPPKPVASLAETIAEPSEMAFEPKVTVPRLPIKEGESKLLTVGKEAVNILAGIPEFLSSPAGVVSTVVAPAAPLTVGTVFTAAMLKDLASQIQESYKDWDKMSGTQKTKAITDMVGTGTFAGLPWLKPAVRALRSKTTPTPEVSDASKISVASDKGETLPLSDATREQQQLQAGTQTRPEGGVGISALEAQQSSPTDWLKGLSENDPKAISNAEAAMLGKSLEGEAKQQAVLGGPDIGRTEVRTPSAAVETTGEAAAETGTLPPQERGWLGQLAGKSPITGSIAAYERASLASPGPLGQALRQMLDVSDPNAAASGARTVLDVLSKKLSPDIRNQIIQHVKDIAYARQNFSPAKIHGYLRSLASEGLQKVPVEEGGSGVQPQAPQGEVPLKPTVTETTPTVPASEMPKTPSKTGLYPAVREVGGKVDVAEAGTTHPEIIKEEGLKAEDIDQRGAATQSGVPTEREPGRQHSTDLPEAQEGQLGGGAAHVSEFPIDPGDPDIYGIAARVREQRAKAGQTIPIEPGKGVSAEEAVIHGQEVLEKNPLAAEQAVDQFKKNKAVSYEGMSATRARAEKEFQAARQTEQKLGTDSPEYQTQNAVAIEWDKASKEMQTEWSKTGRAQQGHTDLDTGTFTGLNRGFQEQTGKNIPEAKVPKAKKTAKQVGDAREASAGAKEKLFTHIRESYARDPEQAAFDAAKKTVREWAVSRAEADAALRVAQKVQADAVKKIQDAAAERARRAADKTITANAKRLADEETARRVREARLAKETADVEVRRQQQRIKEANERITKAAADAAKAERKLNVAKADLPTYVWTKAREYIEKGMDNFDDIRVKIATDEGLPLKKVTEAMGKDRKAKYLADEVWRKQQTARRLHEQAKRWLLAQTIPAYKKWLQNIPAGFFTAKVMGHGTVALGTHAPMGLFKPLEYGLYFKNFGRMYRMVFDPAFYENQVQDLLRNPNYAVARRAGLVNDPYQFEDYNSPDMLKWMGKATAMGNRGYAVLKFIRQDMFDRYWNKLPRTSQIAEVAEAISDSVNHATGVVKVHAPKGAAVAFFAPRLELSRAAWLAADPLKAADTFIRWKTATEGEKRFALMQVKEKAWVFGTGMAMLALNQGILTATGSKQKINGVPESLGGAGFDPMRSDFLKFKALGMQGSYGNAMTAMARLPARLFVGIENEGKFNKIVYEDENVASILFDFTRSQMSPFMGTATDLAIGRDFQRRPLPRAGFGLLPGKTNVPKRLKAQGVGPYTWAEYISVQATPIPASEAIREVWKYGLGMTDEQIASYMKAFAILSIMTGTGARVTEDYNIQK